MKTTGKLRHPDSDKSFNAVFRYVLFGLVLLATQITGLVHSHAEDLQTQADCELCLKLNSNDDAVNIANYSIEISAPAQNFAFRSDFSVDLNLPAVRARAPPGYLLID